MRSVVFRLPSVSASRSLSRCVVSLESSGAGAEHRIDAATERIENLFDELEHAGRKFVSPRSTDFKQLQVGVDQQGDERYRVEVKCSPLMSAGELSALAQRVGLWLSELPDVTPREVRAVERAASEADTDPGEPRPDDGMTREHVAKTKPEGVRRRPVPVAGADEVTDPHAREEVPTRPEGTFSIRRK